MYTDAESKSEELAVVHLKKTTLVEMLCIIKILKFAPICLHKLRLQPLTMLC